MLLKSPSELEYDEGSLDESSEADTATGRLPSPVVRNLFLACGGTRSDQKRAKNCRPWAHFEEEPALQLRRARQLVQFVVRFHLVESFRNEAIPEGLVQDADELLLLLQLAVDLDGQDHRVRRREKGVLRDGLQNRADRDLARQGVAVSDSRFSVVAVPDVDCNVIASAGKTSEECECPRTFDGSTPLLQRADVALYAALTLELRADEVCLPETRCEYVGSPCFARHEPRLTLWLDEMKYSERGRCISWSASSLIAALSDERRKETKPSRSIVPVAGSAYLTNRRWREASSSVLCGGAFASAYMQLAI